MISKIDSLSAKFRRGLQIPRRRFRARLFLTLLALSLVPLAVGIGIAWSETSAMFIHTIGKQMSEAADGVMGQVDHEFQERAAVLGLIAGPLFLGAGRLSDSEIAASLQEVSMRYPDFERLFLVDPNGVIRVSTDSWERGRSIRPFAYFQAARNNRAVYLSAPQFDADGQYVVYISRATSSSAAGPAPTESRRRSGVLVGVLELNRLQAALGALAGRSGKIDIHVADRSGRVILSSHPAESGWNGMTRASVLRTAAPGAVGYSLEDGPHGAPAIVGYACSQSEGDYQSRGWIALVSESRSSALAPVDRLGLQSLFGLMCVAALAAGIAIVLSRSIGRPLHDLTTVARVMAAGDLDVRVSSQRTDEFGQLASAFNEMAGRLGEQRGHLEQANAELEERNRQLEGFVYTISHDLKTPVVSMQGFLALLYKRPEDLPGGSNRLYLDRIRDNVGRLEAMIRELLQLSQMGLMNEAREWIDVTVLAERVGEELSIQLEQTGVRYQVSPDLPGIRAVRRRIHQVLTNLVENSIKYRSERPDARIEVGGEARPDGPVFWVKDNGRGIAPQHHQRVFQIFEQLEGSKEKEGVGGVGLAIVKKAVEMHQGRVWVESLGEGHGTTVFFRIPRDSTQENKTGS